MIIDTVASGLGGLAGGFLLSGNLEEKSRLHRIRAIIVSGLSGAFLGYLALLWAVAEVSWIDHSDFMIAAGIGFIIGAVVPAVYHVLYDILDKIGSNPKEWFKMISGLFKKNGS